MPLALPVTSVLAAAAVVALIALSFAVSLRRMKLDAAHGDAGDAMLLRRIRAHGNFLEYVPIALIVIGLAELGGADRSWLWIVAGGLALGRLLHAIGTVRGSTPLRAAGMIGTYLPLLAAAALMFA